MKTIGTGAPGGFKQGSCIFQLRAWEMDGQKRIIRVYFPDDSLTEKKGRSV